MSESVILFINLVSHLIELFDFESLLDFHVSLERINSHTNFFVRFFHILSRALAHVLLLVYISVHLLLNYIKYYSIIIL